MKLLRKTALITGASSGIGRSTAVAFAQAGARLVLCGRSSEKIQALLKELPQGELQQHIPLICDVRDRAAVETSFQEFLGKNISIDILVNNAGLARGLDKIQEGNVDEWEEMIDTNLKGLLYVTRQILPGMIAANAGHVVNIGSTSGHRVYQGGVVYCATKHAVDAITRGLKKDVEGTRVRISAVDPGAVETNFSVTRFRGDEARAADVYKSMDPLRPDDVAEIVLFCVTRPERVNISDIIVIATDQASVM